MSRYYGQYPNFANLAMTQQQAHLGRLQATGMAASMFPPNPMFNLHPPTTPPKQASSQSVSSRGVTGSNPQYPTSATSASSHRQTATSLARLQQLTNGLENTPGAGVVNPGTGVPTTGNSGAGNTIPGAKPSKQNSALLAPSYYAPATPGQQPGQAQPSSHHTNSGVTGSISGSHGRPDTPATRNHQNLIAHQYSQNHMALNYPGYPPGYLNPWNMYHQAAADAHHQSRVSAAAAHHQATHSAVSGVTGSNPSTHPAHHHAYQMYPGYPGLPGYNNHR